MIIRPVQPHEHDAWLALRRALWPDHPPQEIADETTHYFEQGQLWGLASVALVAQSDEGALFGFAEASLRPYARGCVSSPVGYLEGWYVAPEHRRQGIGAELVVAAEEWARSQGCSEFASDRNETNLTSRAAHLALQFSAVDGNQFFAKQIGDHITPARDFLAIVPYPLNAGEITDLIADPTAGGIAVFLGTTRSERNADGRELIALDYEAYGDMAMKQLNHLAHEAQARWPIVKLAIVHRVGRVKLAEPSVVIAVSCPHRGEAFDACRWIIDTLKKDVAIWKKEIWSDGSGSWVHPSTSP